MEMFSGTTVPRMRKMNWMKYKMRQPGLQLAERNWYLYMLFRTRLNGKVLKKDAGNINWRFVIKMKSNLCPTYLSSLVPQTVNSISRYNLRNANDLQTINARTTLYYNSFLPSTVRAWNNLPLEAQQLESVNAFKYFFKKKEKKMYQFLNTIMPTNGRFKSCIHA